MLNHWRDQICDAALEFILSKAWEGFRGRRVVVA